MPITWWMAESGGGGGLYFRKDTRVDCQWIVRKKLGCLALNLKLNLYSKYTNGILFIWIQWMGKSINLFEIHSRTLERKGYLAFGGQLTTFLCRLNSWKIIFYHLLKVNNFKAEGFSWNWLWIPDWLLALLECIWKWHTPILHYYY